MTTNLPPQGLYQQPHYIHSQTSQNIPSFSPSINQTSYFPQNQSNNSFTTRPQPQVNLQRSGSPNNLPIRMQNRSNLNGPSTVINNVPQTYPPQMYQA